MEIRRGAKMMISHRQSGEKRMQQQSMGKSPRKFERKQQEDGVAAHHFSSEHRGPGYEDKASLSYSSSSFEESVWKERDEAPAIYADMIRQKNQQKPPGLR